MTLNKTAYLVVFFGALAVGAWMNDRMMKRARNSGYRYWMINPRAALAAVLGFEPFVFVASIYVGVWAFSAMKSFP
jgi:hypothetical protein